MTKQANGFSHYGVLILIVVVLAIAGAAYRVSQHNSKTGSSASKASTVSQNGSTAPAGSSQAVTDVLNQQINAEASTDSKYSSSDQSAAQNAGNAANNLGGAYNESNF